MLVQFSLLVEISYKRSSEWTIYSPCFQKFCSSKLSFTLSVKMQQSPSVLISTDPGESWPTSFRLWFLCKSKLFQIVSENILKRHCFIFSLQFPIVLTTDRMHALETLFIFSLQFRIVLTTDSMHALETLFSFFSAVPNRFKYRQNACFRDIVFILLCSFKSFQIPSECMFERHCFHFSLQF